MDSDKYFSLEELPFLQQLVRRMYLNNIRNPYTYYADYSTPKSNSNQLFEFIRQGNLDNYYNNQYGR